MTTNKSDMAMKRELALEEIRQAMKREAWAIMPETAAFVGEIEKARDILDQDMAYRVRADEEPVPVKDQLQYRGERVALGSLISKIKSYGTAVSAAVNKARDQENAWRKDDSMFYVPPSWGDSWMDAAVQHCQSGQAPGPDGKPVNVTLVKPEKVKPSEAEPETRPERLIDTDAKPKGKKPKTGYSDEAKPDAA